MIPDRNDPQKDQPGSELMNLGSRRIGLGVTAWFDVDLSFEWDLDQEYQETVPRTRCSWTFLESVSMMSAGRISLGKPESPWWKSVGSRAGVFGSQARNEERNDA